MAYNFKNFDEEAEGVIAWLMKEYAGVRTGRATPALLDGVQVESYGSRIPLQHIGSVGVEDARTLRVTLWDQGQAKDVERAIAEADLGVSVVVDQSGIRVVFPELTSERRAQLQKLAKTKLEEARVSLRHHRDDTMKDIEAKEKEGDMGEDERFRAKEDLQKRVDAINQKLDELLKKKESEIKE